MNRYLSAVPLWSPVDAEIGADPCYDPVIS